MSEKKELYRSFAGKLDSKTRSGVIISLNQSGNLKVETFSVYHDDPTYIYYVAPDRFFNENTNWGWAASEAGVTNAEYFLKVMKPYRTVKKDG